MTVSYSVLLIINCLICLALFFTSCGRAIKMDKRTRFEIRFGTLFLGVAALCMSLAPFIRNWQTILSWPQVVLAAAMLIVQVATSRLWWRGVPKAFQHPHVPHGMRHAG